MIRTLYDNVIGFLSASRVPNLLIIAATQSMVAIHLLNKNYHEVLNLKFFFFLGSTLLIAAAGYIINDYYDQKIDMINRPQKVVVGIKFKRRLAILSHFLLNVTGVLIGFWVDPFIGAIHIFSSFSLWIYSNQLRRLPIIGNVTIAGLTALTLLIVSIYFRQFDKIVLLYAFFAGTVTLIREIVKDIEDVKGESAFGCSTIPVVWGIRGAKLSIYLISLAGSIFLILFLLKSNNTPLLVYFLISLPLYIWFFFKLYLADTQKEYEVLHQFCNFIIFSGIVSIIFL